MGFWKRLWSFLRSETTIDDQIIEKVAEVKKEVREAKAAIKTAVKETGDVVETIKPKKGRKPKTGK
jgi:hypothetical protein